MQKLQKITKQLFESRIDIHIFFITFFLLVFCAPPAINNLPADKIIRVLIYAIFLLLCVYTGRWCCRSWLLKNKFLKFSWYTSISLLGLFTLGMGGSILLTENNILPIIMTVLFFILLFFLLGLFLSITRNTVIRQINEAHTLQQQKESELQLLRSQLSPHFLFNTLNNLYGLSITQHQKMPGLLLKLSDLLRYSVYETTEDFVPLRNEMAYIENYIELEKIRIGERLVYESDIQKEDIEGIQIAPLLLMVFVENAFKHSKNTYDQNIHVKLQLSVLSDILYFSVKNIYAEETGKTMRDKKSGIGISTTLKRLELLYPKKFLLETNKLDCYYEIKLQLNIK